MIYNSVSGCRGLVRHQTLIRIIRSPVLVRHKVIDRKKVCVITNMPSNILNGNTKFFAISSGSLPVS